MTGSCFQYVGIFDINVAYIYQTHRYYHPHFLRGREDLVSHLTRTRVKGNGMKAASSPETEPNFYDMEPCFSERFQPPDIKESSSNIDDMCARIIFDKEDVSFPWKALQSANGAFPLRSLLAAPPKAVSPDSSPRQPLANISSFVDLPLYGTIPPLMPDYVTESDFDDPHTGDEVLFEGQSFRYLDHLDIDESFFATFVVENESTTMSL